MKVVFTIQYDAKTDGWSTLAGKYAEHEQSMAEEALIRYRDRYTDKSFRLVKTTTEILSI